VVSRLESAACQLRDALYVKMAEAGVRPCKIFLSPTPATALDVCCSDDDCDGQAWVALINTKPIGDARNNTPCAVQIEAMFVLGIARCAYTLDDQGEAPDAEQISENAVGVYRDFGIMRDAVALFAEEFGLFKNDYRLGDFDVHPVRGGCSAYTLEILLVLGSC
jgi:hypothetical protein